MTNWVSNLYSSLENDFAGRGGLKLRGKNCGFVGGLNPPPPLRHICPLLSLYPKFFFILKIFHPKVRLGDGLPARSSNWSNDTKFDFHSNPPPPAKTYLSTAQLMPIYHCSEYAFYSWQ